MLRRHEHGAAPFAADGEALHEAQHHHEDRRPDTDRAVGGHQTHRKSREAHHRQRDDEHPFAPETVAEVAEYEAAEGARHEPDAERGEYGEGARELRKSGEEKPAEH